MPFALLKYGQRREHLPVEARPQEKLRRGYHRGRRSRPRGGLLPRPRHGITNIAVLDKGWLAGGNTARNTTIVRANYQSGRRRLLHRAFRQPGGGLCLVLAPGELILLSGLDGNGAHTSLAKLSPIIMRADAGGRPVYHVLADSAAALYLLDALTEAAEEFGGRLAGLEAICNP